MKHNDESTNAIAGSMQDLWIMIVSVVISALIAVAFACVAVPLIMIYGLDDDEKKGGFR